MASIEIFKNESFGEVRVAGTSEEPLFCLADVCKAIGIANAGNVRSRLDEDDVRLTDTVDSLGRVQQVTYVTESGLYDVIIRSDSERAKPFRKWVTSVVLPSIRKTGGYSVNPKQPTISEKMKVASWIIKTLNLNECSKLALVKSIADPIGLPTPDYTPSKGVLKSATELLKASGLYEQVKTYVFNQRAIEKGYLREVERTSSHGGIKTFKSITKKGLPYGENQTNPNNPKETQPLWYADNFGDLLGILGFQFGGLPYGE